jgi:hypothetical protein
MHTLLHNTYWEASLTQDATNILETEVAWVPSCNYPIWHGKEKTIWTVQHHRHEAKEDEDTNERRWIATDKFEGG